MENELYNISEAEIEEFDKLYNGTIDEKNYYLLKAKMELDEVLKHKYTVYKLLRKEIEIEGLSSKVLKSRFVSLDHQLKKRKRSQRIWFGVVLSFAAILIIVLNIIFTNPNEEIYEKYRYSETGLPVLMNISKQSKMDSVMILIGSNQYEGAYKTLQQMSKNDTVLFYQAYCSEHLGEMNKAFEKYQQLIESQSDMIKQKSEFRTALLSIVLNKKEPFNKMKAVAADSTHVYQKLAKEILTNSVK